MDEVSQNGRRKRRRWTPQEQVFAEVAAACGVSLKIASRAINRSESVLASKVSVKRANALRQCNKNWRARYPDRKLRSTQIWRSNNKEKDLAYQRKYNKENSQRRAEYSKKYRLLNPERCRENSVRWNKNHKERIAYLAQLRYRANPEKIQEYIYRRNAIKRSSRKAALLPATSGAVRARFALWNHRCAFCGVSASNPRNAGIKRLTEDHVMPLSQRGLDEACNIMPACLTCNASKNDSPVETWYRRQPFFTEARWRKIQRYSPAAVAGQLPLALPMAA